MLPLSCALDDTETLVWHNNFIGDHSRRSEVSLARQTFGNKYVQGRIPAHAYNIYLCVCMSKGLTQTFSWTPKQNATAQRAPKCHKGSSPSVVQPSCGRLFPSFDARPTWCISSDGAWWTGKHSVRTLCSPNLSASSQFKRCFAHLGTSSAAKKRATFFSRWEPGTASFGASAKPAAAHECPSSHVFRLFEQIIPYK